MKKLRVTGFPPIVSKDEIIRVFGNYGTIKEVKKAFGAGIAYVYMTYDYQASKAVKELNGTKILLINFPSFKSSGGTFYFFLYTPSRTME